MYRAFYQLSQNIHRKDRFDQDLFISENLAEVLSRLEFIKDKGGITLLTGSPGAGKTTALRHFIQKLNPKLYKVIYIPLPTVSVIEFYRQIAYHLGAETPFRKDRLFLSIQNTISDLAKSQNTTSIIILDDAHFLKDENFHELQLLTNFNFDSADPALFILASHPHLADRLKRPIFESFYQRIKLKIPLLPLNLKESVVFISHILKNASASDQLFNPQATELIHNISHGLPRKITHIMEQALIYGTAHQLKSIDENVIVKIAKEL